MSGPVRGVGLGLRWEFVDELIERTVAGLAAGAGPLPIDFLEISPENYMRSGGKYPDALAQIAEWYPVVTHGLTMSLGGTDPLDQDYLDDLVPLLREMRTPWHSDHLCFGAVEGRSLHDLLPLARRASTATRVADRIRRARDRLGMPLAVENISQYWHPGRAEMTEAEFVSLVCETADCGLLLDVNNAYVNARNFGGDAATWLREAPLDRVVQIHVAGHEWFSVGPRGLGEPCLVEAANALAIDTHGADAPPPVLALLEAVLRRTGPVPVLLERDQNIPTLDLLLDEVSRIREVFNRACVHRASDSQD